METQARATSLSPMSVTASEPESGQDSGANSGDQATTLPPPSRKKQAAVLISAFGSTILTFGYNQTYGVFQEYYLSPGQDVLAPSSLSSTAMLAFVGTLCYGLTWAGGIAVNPVISRIEHGSWKAAEAASTAHDPVRPGHRSDGGRRAVEMARRLLTPKTITVSGILMVSAGFTLASFCTSVWQLLLTQGLMVGFGMSLLYFPFLAPAPEYFTNHRATAMGFILAGGGIGALVFAPVIRALLSSVGGRWTLRIYAAFNLVAGLPVAWAVPCSRFASVATTTTSDSEREQVPERRQRRTTHVSRSLAARATFLFSAAAAFLQAAGAQLPLSFIPSYTVALGLTASDGARLLAASNAINAVSRVLTGYAGDRLGRQNTLIMTLLLAASSVFAFWLASVLTTGTHSPTLLPSWSSTAPSLWLAFIALYSFSAGGYYALFPALIAEVFGIRQYAAVNAFVLLVRGLGTMFGSPIGGQLLGSHAAEQGARTYASIAYWDGALLVGATLCCVGVRWADGKGKGWRWIA